MSEYERKYDRLFAAVVTPYKEDGEVDEAAMRKFLQYFMQPKFVNAGGGILINPEAGEIFYLSRKEKRRNVEIAMEECGGKIPVFAGVADLTTKDSVSVAVDAKEVGANGIFLIPPMGTVDISGGWKSITYPEVWLDMAKAQVEAVDLPAISHPVTSATKEFAFGLPLGPTLQMCKEIPNIIGWKMTYSYEGSRIIANALRSLDRHVAILAASGNFFHEYLATGYFDGTVSGSFNYAMEPMIDHINAWRDKDIDRARHIWHSGLAELHNYIYDGDVRLHIRYKAAAWLRGLIPNPFSRPPLPKPRKEEILTLGLLLNKAGISVIEQDVVNKLVKELPR